MKAYAVEVLTHREIGKGNKMSSHRPFANGYEYCAWERVNCGRCRLQLSTPEGEPVPCEIVDALAAARWDDGTVTAEIAERMGYLDNSPPRAKGFTLAWDCPERQAPEVTP